MSNSNNILEKISNPPPKPRHTADQKVKIKTTPMYIDDNDSLNEENNDDVYDYEQGMIKGQANTDYYDNEDDDDDDINNKKKKTRIDKKSKTTQNDYGIQGFDLDYDDNEEDEKEDGKKKVKKKKKN